MKKDDEMKVLADLADSMHKVAEGLETMAKLYYSLGYQNRRLEYQIFMDGKNPKGGAVTYTVAEW